VKFVLAALVLLVVLAVWLWTPDRDIALLEARYLDAPGDMMDVAGTRLHVRDSGPKDAPVLVMLHGFGASLHTWEPWAQALADEYRVIRFDLPGSGLSAPDATGDYSDARSMHLLIALMDRLGVARATLVGNSMGGRIAWTFAAQHPERVDKLVLLSPDGFASPGFEYDKAPEVPAMMSLMRYSMPRFLLKMSLEPAYADKRALTEELTTRYHDLMIAPGAREAMLQRMAQVKLVDPEPLLRRINAPTLLIWGEQDAMIPFANAADYLKAVAGATLVPLSGIGHLPHEEDPARSLVPLRAFLKASAATG
jgi:pimeloyl-ACP methyl ester carboxylesterase